MIFPKLDEVPTKLSKTGASCHSGQAKRDPESRISKEFWTPAFAGVTLQETFYGIINFVRFNPNLFSKNHLFS